ncbi:MAG: hypothetical protein B6U89_01035 [Desulfurococcales archaeon ex4484_58]|nr:MAG: hypothetical protein B6U89_01035 [Desulfurococcales archaeon ex4484_58]
MSQLIQNIVSFIKKLSGIRWYVVVDIRENKVLGKSSMIKEEAIDKLLAISKLSSELSGEISKYTITTPSGEVKAKSIFAKLNSEGLEIESMDNHVFLLDVDQKIFDHISMVFDKIRRKEKIECKVCGRDLLLETYNCPRCGRTIPFILDRCPFCNYRLEVKKCPGHNGFVDTNGNPVKRDYVILGSSIGVGVVAAGITAYIGSIIPQYNILMYGLGGLIAVLMVLFGITTSSPR